MAYFETVKVTGANGQSQVPTTAQLTDADGVSLAVATYGTSPEDVPALGVNAFVTNPVSIQGSLGAAVDAPVDAQAPENAIQVGAQNPSSQLVALQTDSSGGLKVNVEGQKATYSVSFGGAPLAGVNLAIGGSDTKLVRITQVSFFGYATTAAIEDVVLLTQNAPPSGGTITGAVVGPYDSADAAPAATVTAYSSAAGLAGSQLYQLINMNYNFNTTAPDNQLVFSFGNRGGAKCPVLRGSGQYLCLYFSGAPTGGHFGITIEWTEEGYAESA